MLETYTDLKERIEWLNCFLIQSYVIYKRKEEMLLELIRIPRKSSWQSSLINQLVENAENQRKETEELLRLYDLTILRDLETLVIKINAKLDQLQLERQHSEDKLVDLQQNIEQKRLQYIASQETNKIDTWFCAVDLKNCLKLYQKEKELCEQDYRCQIGTKDNDFYEFIEHYESIIINLSKIEQSHISEKSTNLYCVDFDPCLEQKSHNNNLQNVISCDDFSSRNHEKEQNTYIEDYIRKDNNLINFESDANNSVIKYGIYKTKRSCQSSWSLTFVVYTHGFFLHLFDVGSIIKNNKNLKVQYSNIISRLNAQPTKKLLFFKDKTVPLLDMNEEMEFQELSNTIYNNYFFLGEEDIRHSIYIRNKSVKFNKESYEISIESKSIGSISDLFTTNLTKIRSFLLKDIYELYFGFNEKMVNMFHTIEKNPSPEEITLDIEPQKKPDKKIKWTNIKESNPWE